VTFDGGRTWTTVPGRSGGFGIGTDPFAIGADPSVWWMAGAGAVTLERSTDSGATWQELPSLTSALASEVPPQLRTYPGVRASVAQVLADPLRPNVVFVVAHVITDTYEGASETVFESIDGGASWQRWPVFFAVAEKDAPGFAMTWQVLPGKDALLLARAGSTYNDVSEELDVVSANGVRQLLGHGGHLDEAGRTVGIDWTARMQVDTSGRRVLLESRRRGWIVSTDGGRHFRAIGLALATSKVAPVFDPSRPGRIFAIEAGRLYRSDDDGLHWTGLSRGLPGASGMSVDAAGEIYVYGVSGLAISRDQGHSFHLSRVFEQAVTVATLRPDGRDGLLAATSGGVFRIGPTGTWSRVDRALLPVPATDAAALGRTRGVVAVRSDFTANPTLDEWSIDASHDGLNWTRIAHPGFPTARIPLASDDGGRQVALGNAWTADGGKHWHAIQADYVSAPATLPHVRYATREERGHGGTRVLRSTELERAVPVASIPDSPCQPLDVGGGAVLVYCLHSIWRSTQRGLGFRRLTPPSNITYVASMVADPWHHGRVAMGVVRADCPETFTSGVAISSDAGDSWQTVEAPCESAVAAFDNFAFARDGRLLRFGYLGGRKGIEALDLATSP
jgi:hypothetical protein